MRGSRKFCQRVSDFDPFFSLGDGKRIKMPLKWLFAGVPIMAHHCMRAW